MYAVPLLVITVILRQLLCQSKTRKQSSLTSFIHWQLQALYLSKGTKYLVQMFLRDIFSQLLHDNLVQGSQSKPVVGISRRKTRDFAKE